MGTLFMCFAVPFCIVAGISAPILIGSWLEKKLGLKKPPTI